MEWNKKIDINGYEIYLSDDYRYKLIGCDLGKHSDTCWRAISRNYQKILIKGTLEEAKAACEEDAIRREERERGKREEEIKVSDLKPGRILMVDSGEYSDYSVDGLFVVVKPFNLRLVYDKFIEQKKIRDFEIYLLKEGFIDEVNYSILTTGLYRSEYCFRPGPEL